LEVRPRDQRADFLSPTISGLETGRAIVIEPWIKNPARKSGTHALSSGRTPEARLAEAVGLARAIDLTVVQAGLVTLNAVRPATYIGTGKVDEIAGVAKSLSASVVVMDCPVSPVQQRNLEKSWNVKVIDRTGLILEIFGRRARTREGALQVEHAHLTYQKSRLVRSWTHLERQRGGFGFLGGPGETQIEADRRVIEERIARIEGELDKVRRTRKLHRDSRKRVPYPIIALVGYTNAGKSTLFNRMTAARVLSADMLFATLDPTLRATELPHGARVILSDTVGFISDLPTMLVAAFRATLEEVIEADVILHVRDMSHDDSEAQSHDVRKILAELSIDANDPRVVEVWNKIDLLSSDSRVRIFNLAERQQDRRHPVLVSAFTGEGIDNLLVAIESRLGEKRKTLHLSIDASDGAGLSWLYRHAEVLSREMKEDGRLALSVRADLKNAEMVKHKYPGATDVTPQT
jgi:GTP-binding protein HflX